MLPGPVLLLKGRRMEAGSCPVGGLCAVAGTTSVQPVLLPGYALLPMAPIKQLFGVGSERKMADSGWWGWQQKCTTGVLPRST